ncbi:hypothetical protein V2J09_001489 [Rumex salicifolius]
MSTDANEAVASICEVAVAAADFAFPVSTVQYLIGGVHSVTGLNWWASIAITTFLVHAAAIPFDIWGKDPQAVAAGNKKMAEIVGRTP